MFPVTSQKRQEFVSVHRIVITEPKEGSSRCRPSGRRDHRLVPRSFVWHSSLLVTSVLKGRGGTTHLTSMGVSFPPRGPTVPVFLCADTLPY